MARFCQFAGCGGAMGALLANGLPGDGEFLYGFDLDCTASPSGKAGSALEDKTLALFDELRTPLLRYVLSLRISPERGEEIIQETFLRLFEHLKAGKSDANLRGWLFRVSHNLALQDLRASYGTSAANAAFDPLANAFEDPSPDPEQLSILSERQRRLAKALRELSETDRQCLSLRAEGLRYREIAGVLDIGLSTVADCLRRAVEMLRKEFCE
jgi:RNA polymerase sigma-70 factor (ECF subfamily)